MYSSTTRTSLASPLSDSLHLYSHVQIWDAWTSPLEAVTHYQSREDISPASNWKPSELMPLRTILANTLKQASVHWSQQCHICKRQGQDPETPKLHSPCPFIAPLSCFSIVYVSLRLFSSSTTQSLPGRIRNVILIYAQSKELFHGSEIILNVTNLYVFFGEFFYFLWNFNFIVSTRGPAICSWIKKLLSASGSSLMYASLLSATVNEIHLRSWIRQINPIRFCLSVSFCGWHFLCFPSPLFIFPHVPCEAHPLFTASARKKLLALIRKDTPHFAATASLLRVLCVLKKVDDCVM